MVHRRKSPPPKGIAYERIRRLFDLADRERDADPELSIRYIHLAERIAKRLDISLPADLKRLYCKKCGRRYSSDTRVRIKKGLCLVTCPNCQDLRRLPYRN